MKMAGNSYDEQSNVYPLDENFENPYDEDEKDENITRGELEEILGLPSNGEVKENQYLDFSNKGLGPKAAQEIADHLKFDTKGITIDLSGNRIMDDGAYEFMNLRLGKGVTLNLSDNNIFGVLAAGLIFEISFSEGSTLNLSNNHIDDMDLENYYNDMIDDDLKSGTVNLLSDYHGDNEKMKTFLGMTSLLINAKGLYVLKKGAQLNLSNNDIGDKGAKILVDMIKLEDGAILDLSNNRISEEMKKTLKEKEKSYNDKGVNCKIIV